MATESTSLAPDLSNLDTEYRVALTFEDGVTRFITCRDDQTVADASYRQRVNIPLDCRDGACGTCKAFCDSGEYDGGLYIDDALTADEAEQGYCLPCQMKPRSDLVLQIAGTSAMSKAAATTYTAKIVDLVELSATTRELVLEIPNRSELAFLPGQYVNIDVPGTDESRSYSFSNGPGEEKLRFLVKLTPGGVMSTYLTERAGVGDEVTFTGPNGSFFLREGDAPLLLLAGGTGLAPVLSIMRTLAASGSRRDVRLIYGVSTDEDLVAVDQIEAVGAGLDSFAWDHCVSDPASTAENKGYVMSIMTPEHLREGEAGVYLCGPPPMVEAVRRHIGEQGIEPSGFYFEKFALAASANDAPAASSQERAEAALGESVAQKADEILEELVIADDARGIAGIPTFGAHDLEPYEGMAPRSAGDDTRRGIAGRTVFAPDADRSDGAGPRDLDTGADLVTQPAGRGIAGIEVFPGNDVTPLVARDGQPSSPVAPDATPASHEVPTANGTTTTSDGYQIGEEHPDVKASDAVFDARRALELGALELVVGRLDEQRIAGWRLLAEATVPYVDGDRLVDAAAYTETNGLFHDYLFTQTGNQHLLDAYTALGVKAEMNDALSNASWCHPECTKDHLRIVDAFEAGDRERARELIIAHAEHSKETMHRAMAERSRQGTMPYVSPGRFDEHVVVVTGAGQGIGAQVARRIGAEGGSVVLADRANIVEEMTTEIVRAGGDAVSVLADLETYEGARDLVERAVSEYGRVDVLINNVGGAINFKPFVQFSHEQIDAEITRSLLTTLYACRAVLPTMISNGGGTILNVSSAATRGIHRIPYSAAKGGVNALTASLAFEMAPHNVRVVGVAPGGTQAPPRRVSRGTPTPQNDTEREWFQAHIDQTLEVSLMHRYGTLDEMAAAITFLASPEASYINGSTVPVAGGDQG